MNIVDGVNTDGVPVGSVWRHVRSGNLYRVTGFAVIEPTITAAVLYRGLDAGPGHHPQWCRPVAQFLDGRFVREEDQ